MTVRELIEHLQSLPGAAQEAQAVVEVVDVDGDISTVDIAAPVYDWGEVVIKAED